MPFSGVPTESVLDQFRGHLIQEEQLLVELTQVLNEIRDLLVRKQQDAIEEQTDRHARILKKCEHLGQQRREFLQELARRFDLVSSNRVTIGQIAQSIGGASDREWLLEKRDRLEQFTGLIGRLNRQNAAIIVHEADHAREVVRRLTGAEPGDRYDADGLRQDADAAGSIMSAEG